MKFLRQSTASQAVLVGPFVDETDGVSAETGLTVNASDLRISKNGGNMVAKNSGGATHDEIGYYTATLDATDTDTAGRLRISAAVSGALPVVEDFMVLTANTYDALVLGTDVLEADTIAISGDTAAADNLEAQYDGTGYTDSTAPASRAQVENIGAAGGGSLNFAPIEDNTGGAIDPSSAAFVGTVASGTFASVGPGTLTSHSIDDATNDIDIVYGFQVGGNRVGTSILINADVDGNADLIAVEVYDHVEATWDVVGEIAQDTIVTIPVTQNYTGTGVELGKFYVRFDTNTTTPANLEVFECLVSAANNVQTIGYADGAIWIDTNNGVAGTESFVNGVADNPVNSIADAITIAGNVGLQRFRVAAGSSITLTASAANYEFTGNQWTLAFGGQSIDNAKIEGATVSGTFVSTTAILSQCIINAITGPGITMRNCYFNEVTMTANGTGNWFLNDCRSRVAGENSVTFDYGVGVANTSVNFRDISGGVRIENMGHTGTDTMSVEGNGAVTFNANCLAGAASIRGNIRITDNSGGNVALTITPDVTGYQNGSVWVDEINGTSSGTVVGVDATFQNQSDDFDNAQDVVDALGSQLITIRPGNSITLTDALQGYTINNVQATLNGGSQNVDSTRFNGGFLAGTFTRAGTGVPTFSNCNLNNVTSDRVACLNNCGILGTFTLAEAGVYVFNDAQAAGGTSTSTIDFASLGGATVSMQRWSGSLVVNNMASGDTLYLNCASGGDITLNGADATVEITGTAGTVTNNLTGSPSVSDESVNQTNSGGATAVEIRTEIDNNSTQLAAILTDTSEIGAAGAGLSAVPWNPSWDAEVQSEVTDALVAYDPPTNAELTSGLSGLNDVSAAEVNAEIVDALNVDVYAEPGTGIPPATTSLVNKIGYLFKNFRNRKTQDASTWELYNDDGTTVGQQASVGDDGTDFEKGEIISG